MKIRTQIPLFILAACLMLSAGCEHSVNGPPSVTDTYGHIRASWSPDGATIAFCSADQNAAGIYMVDSLGGNFRKVLSGDAVGLSWSPDGKWLAFSRAGLLFRMKPNGDSVTAITNVSDAIRPAWSPDGLKLSFVQRSPGSGIWIYNFQEDTSTRFLPYGDFPCWNPLTGELVALFSGIDPSSGFTVYQFIAVDTATTAARLLGTIATASDCGFSAMSPGGKTIAFGVKRPDDYAQIWLYDILLVQNVRLTDDGGDYPAWSPDGTRIVYTRTQAGDGGLWVMNADGTNKRRLTKP